jgi:hypothetical protein
MVGTPSAVRFPAVSLMIYDFLLPATAGSSFSLLYGVEGWTLPQLAIGSGALLLILLCVGIPHWWLQRWAHHAYYRFLNMPSLSTVLQLILPEGRWGPRASANMYGLLLAFRPACRQLVLFPVAVAVTVAAVSSIPDLTEGGCSAQYYTLAALHSTVALCFALGRPKASVLQSVIAALDSSLIALFSVAMALNSSSPSLSRMMVDGLMFFFTFLGGVTMLSRLIIFLLQRKYQSDDEAVEEVFAVNAPASTCSGNDEDANDDGTELLQPILTVENTAPLTNPLDAGRNEEDDRSDL